VGSSEGWRVDVWGSSDDAPLTYEDGEN
jgi:hypothetical protein